MDKTKALVAGGLAALLLIGGVIGGVVSNSESNNSNNTHQTETSNRGSGSMGDIACYYGCPNSKKVKALNTIKRIIHRAK